MSRTSASQFHTILPQRLYIRPRITPQLLLPLLLRKAHSGSSKGAKPAVPRPALEPIQIPAPLLLSAHKSGASPYAPGAAQALMNEYARRTSSPASRALGLEFCNDHGTTGEDLTSLARLLLRSNNVAGGFALLRHLLRTCAHMDVPAAVVHLHVLLSAQVARGGGSVLVQAELEGVRKRLAKVAPGHAGAAFRLGEAVEGEGGDLGEAEGWFERAGEGGVVEGWVRLGVLRRGRGDLEGARVVFEKAVEMGSARGCYFLAQLMGELGDGAMEEEGEVIEGVGGKRLGLLVRAGAGGVVDAAYELGSYWLGREPKFAEEWFLIAASRRHAESIVALAQLLMDQGRISSARTWAQKAANMSGEVGAYGAEMLQELSKMEEEKRLEEEEKRLEEEEKRREEKPDGRQEE